MSIAPVRFACLAATIASAASCAGTATSLQPVTAESVTIAKPQRTWIDPAAKGEALVYVTNRSTGDINILSYPQGVPVGAISGFVEPEGECVDAAGDVFITDSQTATISVFAHGGVVPIRTLAYPHAQPYDCSIDPATGNLAVTNRLFSRKPHSAVAIYTAGQGLPTTYAHAAFQTLYCGYDNEGNLYLDGSDHRTEVAELPHGGSTIVNVQLDQPIARQGSIQWDGQYVVLASLNPPVAYRVAFSGRSGTIVGSTSLDGTIGLNRVWIEGDKILGAGTYVYTWPYPAGGSPVRRYTGFTEPADAVVSEPARDRVHAVPKR